MSVEIVEVNSCKRNLVVELPREDVAQEIDKLAREYAQRVKVPGFRPGRVPLNIIKQRYAEELRNDATHDLIQRSWRAAVSDKNLNPLSEPVVDEVRGEPGDPLRFTLSFEVLPQLEVKDYKGVPLAIAEPKIEDADIDKALEQVREQHAESVPVESDPIRDGHIVTLQVDGEFAAGGKPLHEDDVVCVVGDPEMNDTFSENLRGAKAGDVRSFDVLYPQDYHRKRFAGDTVHYRVLVKGVNEKQLPDATDEFAKDVGAENLSELRNQLKNDLVTKASAAAEKKARTEVLDEVVRRNPVDAPDALIQGEMGDFARGIAANLAQQGVDVNNTSIDWKKVFDQERPRAEQSVRRTIILDAIAAQEKIEVTEEELDGELQKLGEGANKTGVALRAQLEKDNRIQGFRDHLRRNKALDFIYRNANITRG